MELFSFVAKISLMIFGVLFVLISIILFLKSVPKYTLHSYEYITEGERVRRSVMAGSSFILLATGVFMTIFGLQSDDLSFKSLSALITVVIVMLPPGVLIAFSTYKRLWTFTKTKDDVVFLPDNNKSKK